MHITTMTQKGQVTVPAQIRKKLGLKPGQKIVFSAEKGKATLKQAPDFFSFRGALKGKPYDKKKARKAVGEYLGQKHQRELSK